MESYERARHTRQAQYELMVSYMERHGDLQYLTEKMETQRRWVELTNLLNDKSLGEPKSLDKWRKCWSDFKNNTKKKEVKIKRNEVRVDLTRLEKRLLKLIESRRRFKRKTTELSNENTTIYKVEAVGEEVPCEMTPTSPSQCYIPDVRYEITDHRKSSASSSASISSHEETPTHGKRKRSFKDSIKDVADKYLEFERERENLAHIREMARIKQNDQLIMIFGKIVNVLETLTPSIQKYLDRDNNGDR